MAYAATRKTLVPDPSWIPPPRPIVVKDDGVDLKLSHEEASALVAIFAWVGGHPDKSPRGYIAAIDKALGAIGYTNDSGLASEFAEQLRSSNNNTGVYFPYTDGNHF